MDIQKSTPEPNATLRCSAEQGVPPERVSFIDALDALRHGGPSRLRVNPTAPAGPSRA